MFSMLLERLGRLLLRRTSRKKRQIPSYQHRVWEQILQMNLQMVLEARQTVFSLRRERTWLWRIGGRGCRRGLCKAKRVSEEAPSIRTRKDVSGTGQPSSTCEKNRIPVVAPPALLHPKGQVAVERA